MGESSTHVGLMEQLSTQFGLGGKSSKQVVPNGESSTQVGLRTGCKRNGCGVATLLWVALNNTRFVGMVVDRLLQGHIFTTYAILIHFTRGNKKIHP